MIAKFKVTKVQPFQHMNMATNELDPATSESLEFSAVTDAPFDDAGKSDDNSFARWTPTGELRMTVTNPSLFGKFKVGEKYYLRFTAESDEPKSA